MITQCPYCQMNTAGQHEQGCPNGASKSRNIYASEVRPDGTQGYFVAYDECDFCHKQSPFTMAFPYGSAYDGWYICVECIKKHVEPALIEFLTR